MALPIAPLPGGRGCGHHRRGAVPNGHRPAADRVRRPGAPGARGQALAPTWQRGAAVRSASWRRRMCPALPYLNRPPTPSAPNRRCAVPGAGPIVVAWLQQKGCEYGPSPPQPLLASACVPGPGSRCVYIWCTAVRLPASARVSGRRRGRLLIRPTTHPSRPRHVPFLACARQACGRRLRRQPNPQAPAASSSPEVAGPAAVR